MSFRFCGFADEAEKSLAGQISTLQEVGWDAIELRLIDGENICDLTDDAWERVREALQENGIAIVGFGGQIANWSRRISGDFSADREELARVAPRMRETGTRFLRIMSYPNDRESPLSKAAWKAEAVRRISLLAQVAEDEGIILGHENCSGYGETVDGFRELVESVNSPAFKLILDTGNTTMHERDPEATWRFYEEFRDEIAHVHIKAARPKGDGSGYATCHVDEDPLQRRILTALRDSGYDGWLSIEPHLKAVVHEGRDVDDSGEARRVWVDYAQRLESLVADL